MSLKGLPVSSKFKVENWNFNVSGTSPADAQARSQCSDPAMIVLSWQCIQQNQSNPTSAINR